MEILYIVIAVALVSAGVYWRIQYTSDNRPVGKNANQARRIQAKELADGWVQVT
jgi:hypothetical protein